MDAAGFFFKKINGRLFDGFKIIPIGHLHRRSSQQELENECHQPHEATVRKMASAQLGKFVVDINFPSLPTTTLPKKIKCACVHCCFHAYWPFDATVCILEMQSSQQWCCSADKMRPPATSWRLADEGNLIFESLSFPQTSKTRVAQSINQRFISPCTPRRGKASCWAVEAHKTLWNVIMFPMVSPFLVSWSEFLCAHSNDSFFGFPVNTKKHGHRATYPPSYLLLITTYHNRIMPCLSTKHRSPQV